MQLLSFTPFSGNTRKSQLHFVENFSFAKKKKTVTENAAIDCHRVACQVKVVELKVTWITKSYSPRGSDSVYPPPSTITQENLCRSAPDVPSPMVFPPAVSTSTVNGLTLLLCGFGAGCGAWVTTTTRRGSWERGPCTCSPPSQTPRASPARVPREPLSCRRTLWPERSGWSRLICRMWCTWLGVRNTRQCSLLIASLTFLNMQEAEW